VQRKEGKKEKAKARARKEKRKEKEKAKSAKNRDIKKKILFNAKTLNFYCIKRLIIFIDFIN